MWLWNHGIVYVRIQLKFARVYVTNGRLPNAKYHYYGLLDSNSGESKLTCKLWPPILRSTRPRGRAGPPRPGGGRPAERPAIKQILFTSTKIILLSSVLIRFQIVSPAGRCPRAGPAAPSASAAGTWWWCWWWWCRCR